MNCPYDGKRMQQAERLLCCGAGKEKHANYGQDAIQGIRWV